MDGPDTTQTEDALIESEARLRAIFDNEPECVKLLGPDGDLLEMNRAGLRMIEADSFEQIENQCILPLVAPEHREAFRDLTDSVFRGESGVLKFKIFGLRGGSRWLETHAAPLRDKAGKITALLGITRDITEQKLAAETLELSERRFRSLFEAAPDGIAIIDTEGHYVDANRSLCKMLGYARRDLLGRHISEVMSGSFAPSSSSFIDTFRSIDHQYRSWELIRNNGSAFPTETVASIMPDGNVLIMTRDVTERESAETALRESEEKFMTIFKAAPGSMMLFSLPDRKTVEVNNEFSRITGFTREEALGRDSGEIGMWADPGRRDQFLKLLAQQGYVTNFEADLIHKSGEIKNGIASSHKLKVRDKEYLLGVFLDITERKRAEVTLQASESRYRNLVEQAADGIFIGTSDGRIEDVNTSFCEMLGYAPDELLAMAAHKIVARSERDRLSAALNEVDTGKPYLREWTFVRKDGSEVPVEVNARRLTEGKLLGIVRDITDRRRADESLRDAMERLRLAVHASNIGLWDWDIATNRVVYSREWKSQLGYDENEIVDDYSEWESRVHPDDVVPTLANVEATLAHPTAPLEAEFRLRHKDGSYRDIYARGEIWTTADGKPLRFMGCHVDMTDRKHAAKELARTQERYRDLVENAHDMIYTHDLDGNFTSVNRAGVQMLGYSVADLLQMNLLSLVAPEYRDQVREMIHDEIRSQESASYAPEMIGKDGRRIAVEINSRLVTRSGVPIGMEGIARDVTERRRSEVALREADQRAITAYEALLGRISALALALGTARDLSLIYRSLCDFAVVSMPMSGMFVSLYDSRQRLRKPVFAWSDGAEIDVASLPVMEMGGTPNSQAVLTGKAIITDNFQDALKGHEVVNVGMDQDPTLPESSLVVPMAVMGRVVGTVEVQSAMRSAFGAEHAAGMQMAANLAANAIENVRLLQREQEQREQLQQSQKLESVGLLAGGIAHDFNNLLTAISGYSELALLKLDTDDPLARNVNEIRKASERAAGLTGQLLAFSRKQVLQPRVLDLNSVVKGMEGMMIPVVGENMKVRTILSPTLGHVEADPGQIEQVILNLVVNARDAMPGGGHITIETSNVEIDDDQARLHACFVPGWYAMLAISDTGCGMDAETQKSVFEPFFTTKPKGQGTGLGLSTVYGIVKQSGGFIWVYSELGIGTTFKIYLKLVSRELSISKPPQSDALTPVRGVETILLVEDEEIVRNFIRDSLEQTGYTVLCAASGEEALALAGQTTTKIDLMVTDVIMPGITGRELADRLSNTRIDLQVLFMSGYTDNAIVVNSGIVAETNFLQKPFGPGALLAKIREILYADVAPTLVR